MSDTQPAFRVMEQARKTAQWLKEYKDSITPSNASKLSNRLERNKEKCPDEGEGYHLIYFDGDKNISLFAKELDTNEDGSIKVSGVGFNGLSMRFGRPFDNLHTLVFFFYSIKGYWELELDNEQENRDRIKELSAEKIKEGKSFSDGSVIQDTWGNFVVNIKKKDDDKELSRRLTLINDNLYIEHEGEYFKLMDENA